MLLTVLALGFKALYASLALGMFLGARRRGHGCRPFWPQLGVPCSSYVATLQSLGPRVDDFGWVAVSRRALKQGCSSLSWPSPRANPVPHINDGLLHPNNREFELSHDAADKS